MRILLTITAILFVSIRVNSQETAQQKKDSIPLPRIVKDTLFSSSGYKIWEGGKLKMGTGSMPDGDFKFIRRNSASIFNYSSNTGYQGLANQANSLPRGSSGLEYKVVRVEKRGDKKHGYAYYAVINVGMIRYEVDVDNAITVGELHVPDEFKPKKEVTAPIVVIKQESSLADELAKLKKLYDDGALTKEEYEAAKKKLLEKQ